MSFLADLDFNIYATDSFVIGGEGIYRQNDKPKLTPGKSTKIFGGILDLNYAFSDVWDGTIKYSLLKLNQGLGSADANDFWTIGNGAVTALNTANNGWLNEISLAGGYQITDGAKFKAEFRLDWTKMSKQSKNLSYDLIGMFEYAF
jgi:hypothetical protein